MASQFSLFDGVAGGEQPGKNFPDGFNYLSAVISPEEEESLLTQVKGLPLQEFEFHGFTENRRVLSFGWHYDFAEGQFQRVTDIPHFLRDIRTVAARFADLKPKQLVHVLVTKYAAGAGIGWHRDKAVFGDVVGMSLLAPCRFRLRRKVGERWERRSLEVEPRSAYLLSGPARTIWEHSILPVDTLRYSLTFRTLKRP